MHTYNLSFMGSEYTTDTDIEAFVQMHGRALVVFLKGGTANVYSTDEPCVTTGEPMQVVGIKVYDPSAVGAQA